MKSRVAACAVAVVLLAGACGSRADDSSGTDLDGGTSSTTVAPASDGRFGTAESPCGDGDASGTSLGVTDTEITVTSYSDSGGQVGGLMKGVDDTGAAFVKWCNDQGGINGRKINLELRGANLFEYGAVVSAACEDSLALVGGFATFDDAGAPLQVDCGLPNVPAAAGSSVQSGADLTWQVLPSPPNDLMVGAATELKRLYPEAVTSAGMIHPDIAMVDYIAKRMQEALTKIGYEFVYSGTAAIGEANWAPFVVDMKDKGVAYLEAVSSWEEIVNLQTAMVQQGFEPEVTALQTNLYTDKYVQGSNGGAEGSYVQLTTWPFDEADQNRAMAQYLEALEAAVPGAVPEQMGVQSWSAWLMWATAVKNLGSDVTRASLEEELDTFTSWDGGGLHGTSDPAANTPAPCFILMQVQGDAFARAFPTKEGDAEIYEEGNGYSCNDDYIVHLDTDYDNGARR